jgi:ferric-dicitrate binding protein FerR (iron transport regulator)
MNNDTIWSNVARNIAGESSEEDIRLVNKWLSENENNKKIYNTLLEMWNTEKLTTESKQSLFDSVKRKITVYENRPKKRFYATNLFRIAAVGFLLVAMNLSFYLFREKPAPEPVAWQEIVVPRGNRMKITLPDSTSIWLNNETKFRYASNFSSTNRQVELSGEAYFDVHHDSAHPFTVKIGNKKIKVYGTRFSVNAYPEDKFIETSLISGSVVFENDSEINGKSEFKIEPGNSLFYDKTSNTVANLKIQSSFYEYWEKGMYSFKDEKFEALAVKLKRIFNVEVVFEDEFLKSKTYTGTININDNIFIFMEAIRRTSVQPIEYRFNNNMIYVKLKNK